MLDVLGLDPMSDHWARETHLQEVAGAGTSWSEISAEASAERGEFEARGSRIGRSTRH